MTEVELLRKMLGQDAEIKKLLKKVSDGATDFAIVQEYGQKAGNILLDAVNQAIADVDDTAEQLRIVKEMLLESSRQAADVAMVMQQSVNKEIGTGLKAISGLDKQLTEEIIKSLSEYGDVREALKNQKDIVTIQPRKVMGRVSRAAKEIQAVPPKTVDNTMKKNAEFHASAGLSVTVSREYDNVGVHTTDKGGGKACQWCLSRCGSDVPYKEAYAKGMFERHPGCGCVITYKSARGAFTQGRGQWESNTWSEDRRKRIRKLGHDSRKVYADIYLDDKGVRI